MLEKSSSHRQVEATSSQGSDEPVHLRILARVFPARI